MHSTLSVIFLLLVVTCHPFYDPCHGRIEFILDDLQRYITSWAIKRKRGQIFMAGKLHQMKKMKIGT